MRALPETRAGSRSVPGRFSSGLAQDGGRAGSARSGPFASDLRKLVTVKWPTAEERLEQLNRLDRWCVEAPAWKVNLAASGLGMMFVVVSLLVVVWLPCDRMCVVAFGHVLCLDAETGQFRKP